MDQDYQNGLQKLMQSSQENQVQKLQADSSNVHVPVLLKEVISNILSQSSSSNNYLDGTFGGGGYSQELFNKALSINQKVNLFACDLDSESLERAKKELDEYLKSISAKETLSTKVPQTLTKFNKMNQTSYKVCNFADYIQTFDDEYFGGIMLDLGFSSNQLESGQRGFSYLKPDEELDLRYDVSSGQSLSSKLYKIIDGRELGQIIFRYSGEKLAMRIGGRLWDFFEQNKSAKLTVGSVVEVITEAIPRQFLKNRYSILSRVWQALRIWVNDEFTALETFMDFAPTKLAIGGRLAIVSFHSLEDKIIAGRMRELCQPLVIDDFGNAVSSYKLITKKAIEPSTEEVVMNPRSRSGRLRVMERIQE